MSYLWLQKGTQSPSAFHLHEYKEGEGGKLHGPSTLKKLQLATLEVKVPDEEGFAIVAFQDDPPHFSYERFAANTKAAALAVTGEDPPPPPLSAANAGVGHPSTDLLPEEAVTSTELFRAWQVEHLVESSCSSLLQAPQLEKESKDFQKWWDTNNATLQALPLRLRPIINETTGGADCYNDFAGCVTAITEAILGPTCKATVFTNKAASNKRRPDILAVCHEISVEPLPENMFGEGSLVFESKRDLKDGTNRTKGYGELITRSTHMRKKRKATSHTLFGGLTDNRLFLPVRAQTGSGKQLLTVSSPFILVLEQPQQPPQPELQPDQQPDQQQQQQQPATGQLVDTSGRGFKELCFIVWLGLKGANLAAAAEPRVACLRDGQCVTVRSSSGVPLPLVVDAVLSAPGPSGCVYAAAPASAECSAASSMRLVLKVGPPPLLASQARTLGLSRMAWTQVEREVHVRQALGDGTCPGLPRTVLLGRLDLSASGHTQQHVLHGAPAVVMELCGEPLLARGAHAYPRLVVAEVEALVRQLMVPLLFLQCHGIMHGDVHARNIARYFGSPDARFYLFDLGTAGTAEEWQQPDWEAPVSLLFSCHELLVGKQPGPLADLQSLVFVALSLAGIQLPWAEASAERDSLTACAGRWVFMGDPGQLPGWAQLFSAELRRVLEEVLATALRGRAEQQALLELLASEWLPFGVVERPAQKDNRLLLLRDQFAPLAVVAG